MPYRCQKYKVHLWEIMGSASSKLILLSKKYKGLNKFPHLEGLLQWQSVCYGLWSVIQDGGLYAFQEWVLYRKVLKYVSSWRWIIRFFATACMAEIHLICCLIVLVAGSHSHRHFRIKGRKYNCLRRQCFALPKIAIYL